MKSKSPIWGHPTGMFNSVMEPGSAVSSGCSKRHELAEGPTDLNEEACSALNTLSKLCFAKILLLPALISLLNVGKGEV